MSSPSASYSITIRVGLDSGAIIPDVSRTIAENDGLVTALDVTEPIDGRMTIDVTCNAVNEVHAEKLGEVVDALLGANVVAVSDRTFLMHRGGVIGIAPKVALESRDDLSMAYTPGVARISAAIAKDKRLARKLTIKRNTVAVVTDGSAVLGLGNIGPEAALPVMEGKALLFKRFANIDAWPVCLDTQDTEEIIAIVKAISPSYGGINLEDIAAPRCFEIEERLREALDIPVFHDDQHGTAVVVYAALLNALRVVGKQMTDTRVALLGAGAAGMAIAKLLLAEGVADIVACDREGILDAEVQDLDRDRLWLAQNTNKDGRKGDIAEAMRGADIFIGVSSSNLITEEHLQLMAEKSIVFALANPDPEIEPLIARKYAAIVATGRSDEPNQINNVLAFPGIFRGMLDVGASKITTEVELAAGRAIADSVSSDELSADYIVPTVFNPNVVKAVAAAVQKAARKS